MILMLTHLVSHRHQHQSVTMFRVCYPGWVYYSRLMLTRLVSHRHKHHVGSLILGEFIGILLLVKFIWFLPGLNTSPSKATTEYELHVTGDVSLMMRQYLQLTNDMRFLKEDGGYKAIADIANFWVSKSVYSQKKRKFEILGNIENGNNAPLVVLSCMQG